MSDNLWQIQESGRIFTSHLLDMQYNEKGEIDGADFSNFGLDGKGFGIDLGATYQLLDNLTLSAAITDIGVIKWKGSEATLTPETFSFDGFHHIGSEDEPITDESDLDQEVDQFEEDAKQLIRFNPEQDKYSTQPCKSEFYLWNKLYL